MVSCGHQLDADWLLGSSAGAPIGGAGTAAIILQNVFAEDGNEELKENISSQKVDLQCRGMRLSLRKCQNSRSCARYSAPLYHDFTNFDEDEHLDGCPVKWLYRRRTEQPPISVRELSVRKMNLKNRRKRKKRSDESCITSTEKIKTEGACFKDEMTYNEDDGENDIITSYSNFLHPRPLAGFRPWFYVLLAPRSTTHDLKLTRQFEPRKSVSIRSLSLPQVAPLRAPNTPRASRASRWAGPSAQPPQRSLQAPPALDISLRGGELSIAEDQLYRLKKLFHYIEANSKKDEEEKQRRKHDQRRRDKSEIHVICSRVQFFERPGKPMR